ncbi:hypothetical protein FEM48_Zijuj09G0107500 [Ziziphus jujuba var. spinosa]|uniref:BURP domain-containing protein n=1 Tax=Ziziphus jujuba var. spinosa TaxID=714518 RepID=A0A978USJ6_ZIZJJ|nr:hypothetical protein FEM48_Zijuj09G0107500 [Ziziphus jujuba var. spinosa]
MVPGACAPSVLIIFFLFFFMGHHGNSTREITQPHDHPQEFSGEGRKWNKNFINIPQEEGDFGGAAIIDEANLKNHHHMPFNGLSQIDHMKASKRGFFTLDDLHVGKTMPIDFPSINISTLPRFLPRQEADLIPFSSNKLPYLLQLFSFSEGSPEANLTEKTLKICELKHTKGETKLCATSFESMLDSVRAILGKENHYKVETIEHIRNPVVQNYTFLEVSEELSKSKKLVACHILPYPYAVFYCHSQEAARLFKVSVGGENGDRVEGVAVCHMDTSDWSPSNQMLLLLGVKRGTPICHLISPTSLIWVSY